MKLKKFNDMFSNNSIMEGNKSYPYRFKTEEEMINEFGRNWEEGYDIFGNTGWNTDMRILLGEDYPFMEYQLDFDSDLPRGSERLIDKNGKDWEICWKMLIKNKPKVPNYKPRKIYIDK